MKGPVKSEPSYSQVDGDATELSGSFVGAHRSRLRNAVAIVRSCQHDPADAIDSKTAGRKARVCRVDPPTE